MRSNGLSAGMKKAQTYHRLDLVKLLAAYYGFVVLLDQVLIAFAAISLAVPMPILVVCCVVVVGDTIADIGNVFQHQRQAAAIVRP